MPATLPGMHVTRRTLVAVASTMLAVGTAPLVAQAAPPPPGESVRPTTDQSWTAHILYPVAARRTPGGAVTMRLQHYTSFSQTSSVYMVTDRRVVRKKTWYRIHLPKRPNGSQGWVPSDAVEIKRLRTWIRVSTGKRTVQVLTGGKVVKTFRAAVGTGGTPTPRGLFAIYDSVPTGGQLGPRIMVLTAHSNVLKTFAGGDGIVGIHGWPSSAVLGKAVSHGCIRLSRDAIRSIAPYARPGVPVHIGA